MRRVSKETFLDSSIRAAVAQSERNETTEPSRRRSMARTWGGIALMAAGASVMMRYGEEPCTFTEGPGYYHEECRYGTNARWNAADVVGSGAFAAGLLLATLWSHVPVTLDLAPRRVAVSKTIGF